MTQARAVGAGFGPNPVALSINDASVVEGAAGTTSVVLTVSLSGVTSVPVTVDFATADATASSGSDYVARSGSLSFAPGQTSRTIELAVNGDTSVEPDESLRREPGQPGLGDDRGRAGRRDDHVRRRRAFDPIRNPCSGPHSSA